MFPIDMVPQGGVFDVKFFCNSQERKMRLGRRITSALIKVEFNSFLEPALFLLFFAWALSPALPPPHSRARVMDY